MQSLENESVEGWKDWFHTRALFTQRKKCFSCDAITIYNRNRLWSYVSIPVYAKTMLPPTHVNTHSRANQRAPADRLSRLSGPLADEGHTVPIV